MSASILLSTSDLGRVEVPEHISARTDKHPMPYSTVTVEGRVGGFWLTLYTNDTAKGREFAAAIIQACDETDQERERRRNGVPEEAVAP